MNVQVMVVDKISLHLHAIMNLLHDLPIDELMETAVENHGMTAVEEMVDTKLGEMAEVVPGKPGQEYLVRWKPLIN